MPEFWLCLMQCKVPVQITEQLPRQIYSEHCQTLMMEHFAKQIISECRCATRNFSEKGEGGRLWK